MVKVVTVDQYGSMRMEPKDLMALTPLMVSDYGSNITIDFMRPTYSGTVGGRPENDTFILIYREGMANWEKLENILSVDNLSVLLANPTVRALAEKVIQAHKDLEVGITLCSVNTTQD